MRVWLSLKTEKYKKMKKSLLFILFLALLLPAAIAKHKKAQPQKDLLSVTMHRSACFGHCPDYQVKVDKGGLVTYTGYMFAKDSGIYEKNIGAAAAKNILATCTRYRIDTCKDIYNNTVPDLPGLHFIVQYKTVTKKIANAGFGPGFLREIAGSIDAIAQVDSTWKHIPAFKR